MRSGGTAHKNQKRREVLIALCAYRKPSPQGEGYYVKRQNILGSPSGELPEGERGLRSGIA